VPSETGLRTTMYDLATERYSREPRLIRRRNRRSSLRGRPRADGDWFQRKEHIQVAFDHLIDEIPVPLVARTHKISPSTVYRWTAAALSYDDVEALALRRRLAQLGEAVPA
jgi:hypothetical protein